MRGVGHVTCNAHEQQGVAVRAPETVDADVVATAIDAIGVACDGCSFAWQDWDPVGVLASAGKATPLGMFKKALRGEDKGSSHAKQRMALLPSVDTVPGPGWAGCVPVLVSSAAPAPWLQR